MYVSQISLLNQRLLLEHVHIKVCCVQRSAKPASMDHNRAVYLNAAKDRIIMVKHEEFKRRVTVNNNTVAAVMAGKACCSGSLTA